MNVVTQTQVSLRIAGADLDADRIASLFGIAGSYSGGEGSRLAAWDYLVDVDPGEPVDEHLQALANFLEGAQSAIQTLMQLGNEASVTVDVTVNDIFLYVQFGARLTSILSRHGIGLDVHLHTDSVF